MHACSYLPRFPKPVSHTCTHAHTLWLLSCPPFFLDSQLPVTKLCPVSQIPLFLHMAQSVPPAFSLLPCVPSSRVPCVRVLVVLCGMWQGGGRQAGLKGGAQLFPHRASTPHWSVAHLAICRDVSRSRRCREMELRTLRRHTLLLNWCYTQSILNECKRGNLTFHSPTCWGGRLPKKQIRSRITI